MWKPTIGRQLAVFILLLLLAEGVWSASQTEWSRVTENIDLESFPADHQVPPLAPPSYMVDDQDFKKGLAPVHGSFDGAVWAKSGSFEAYMEMLRSSQKTGGWRNSSWANNLTSRVSSPHARQAGEFWVPELSPLGKAPHAGDGYVFYRNVMDFGADNTGKTNTLEAINAAIEDGERCGKRCGNTFVKGAIIYFPPGTYLICEPIIQLYYTQFIGDPHDRPIIKGCDTFKGIALIDVDPYIPNVADKDGNGINWYINQNQFFRQIRNFVLDLTIMPEATNDAGQELVPTGIHWQVSQACTLQNILVKMPTEGNPKQVGIYTENGSGGFVSDLEFEGGAIGWRVGSQQYTASRLTFRGCKTAVQMIWDWGFNWHDIVIKGSKVAFNISGRDGIDGQGIGSISLVDSSISGGEIGILTNELDNPPSIVIDHTSFEGVGAVVQTDKGNTLLGATPMVDLWAHGQRFKGKNGTFETGMVARRPQRPKSLVTGDGKFFTRPRPQYEDLSASSFLVATQHGCSNDGTGENTAAINAFLKQALSSGLVAYFPGGIYHVEGTVTIPTGSRVQGASWSQIQAEGSYFQDMSNPKVVVRVGEDGDVGTMEIVDMLFTVKGPTAGAIMVEWNVHEASQGSAGMWDSHIRIGGGISTDLDIEKCPKGGFNEECICASMLLHVTKNASGYFENVWAWVADHDNNMVVYYETDKLVNQISLYGARGILVESQGPCWFYGTGSEHVAFYQYEMYKAKNIYLGHIQTESPYYQPAPTAPNPFNASVGLFPGDPKFDSCTKDSCREAWGLRIIDSESVIIHSASMYSWFSDYVQQPCLDDENCQEFMLEVTGSKEVTIFNTFTKGVEKVGGGEGYAINQNETQSGFTTEVSVWFPQDELADICYIGKEVFETHKMACQSPGIIVLQPRPLPDMTVIKPPAFTTSLNLGGTVTTLTVTPSPVTINEVPFSNINITGGITNGEVFPTYTSVDLDPVTVIVAVTRSGQSTKSTFVVAVPPWPQSTGRPREISPLIPNGTTTATDGNGNRINIIDKGIDDDDVEGEDDGNDDYELPVIPVFTEAEDIEPIFNPIEKPLCIIVEEVGIVCEPDEEQEDDNDYDDDDDDDSHGVGVLFTIKCDELWFFNFCPTIKGRKVHGWKIRLPIGIIGPGPPPPIKLPDGWKFQTPPPTPPIPWPQITNGPAPPAKPTLTLPKKDPSCDDNKIEVPRLMISTEYLYTSQNGRRVTTSTITHTETEYETGCPTPEFTSGSTCRLLQKRSASQQLSATASLPTERPASPKLRRQQDPEWQKDFDGIDCNSPVGPVIIYFNPDVAQSARTQVKERLDFDGRLSNLESHLFRNDKLSPPEVFVYLPRIPNALADKFERMDGVSSVVRVLPGPAAVPRQVRDLASSSGPDPDTDSGSLTVYAPLPPQSGTEVAHHDLQTRNSSEKRATAAHIMDPLGWWLSQISSPPGQDWNVRGENGLHRYNYQGSLGIGHFIYLHEQGIDKQHPLSFIEDLQANPDRQGKCVVNISRRLARNPLTQRPGPDWEREAKRLLRYLTDDMRCVVVNSSGNGGRTADGPPQFPKQWAREKSIPGMIVVNANGEQGFQTSFGQGWDATGDDEDMVYAPGNNLRIYSPTQPLDPSAILDVELRGGTSFAAPLVSGLVCYLRGLESKWKSDLEKPENVVKMVLYLSRVIKPGNVLTPPNVREDSSQPRPKIIWNGNVGDENCLTAYQSEEAKKICDPIVRDIPGDLDNWNPNFGPDGPPGSEGDSVDPDDGLLWTQGPASPTCKSNCGKLCTGFFCSPSATAPAPSTVKPSSAAPTSSPKDADLDAGHACACSGIDCDSSSPSCCRTFTCPACNCNDNGCSANAPACCATGTCKWDEPTWTSGRNGECQIHIGQDYDTRDEGFTISLESHFNSGPKRSERLNVWVAWDSGRFEWQNGPGADRTRLAEGIYIEAPSHSVQPGQARLRIRDEAVDTDTEAVGPDQRPRPDPGDGASGPGGGSRDLSWMYMDLVFITTDVTFSSADTDSSKKPYCRVSDWKIRERGFNGWESYSRDMDCYWDCGKWYTNA